jgi:methylmalonyl-CoA mutase
VAPDLPAPRRESGNLRLYFRGTVNPTCFNSIGGCACPTNKQTDAALPTFDEFAPTPYEEWRKVVDKFLKGAPFEKRLVTKTYENIDLQPMYRQENRRSAASGRLARFCALRARRTTPLGYVAASWDVAQEIPCGTPAAFNAALRPILARGQNAVNLVLDRPTLAGVDADQAEADDVGKGGLSVSSVADLAQALAGVDLESTPIFSSRPAPAP